MEDRENNLRITIEGCRRLLLLDEWACPQDFEALRRFLAATEAALAEIEGQRKETTRVEEHADAT
jgi:hypothetical protein